jgi:hypothetical protein
VNDWKAVSSSRETLVPKDRNRCKVGFVQAPRETGCSELGWAAR